jgi:diketogulonate reductase-like aldo/keto reductase
MDRRQFTTAALGAASIAALPTALAGPEHIIHKSIPSSGEAIPLIGIGTNRFGVNDTVAARVPLLATLKRFHQLGGRQFDTAPDYDASESVVGDLIAELGIGDDLFFGTKTDQLNADDTRAQMLSSSEKLKTEKFDLMQVHNLLGWYTAFPVLREWQQEGRVRYIGMTTSMTEQYEDFESIMQKEKPDLIQINYSLKYRKSADRILPLAADLGMGVIINRTLHRGKILKAIGNKPLPVWAKDFGCNTWAQFLLKYAASHPSTTAVLVGMTQVHHVEENFRAAHGRLPSAEERLRMGKFYDAL